MKDSNRKSILYHKKDRNLNKLKSTFIRSKFESQSDLDSLVFAKKRLVVGSPINTIKLSDDNSDIFACAGERGKIFIGNSESPPTSDQEQL